MAYGVATNNIFDLLDEENEDPQALASKATDNAEKPKAKKEAAPKAKEVPKTAVASNVEARMRGLSTSDGPGRGRGRGLPRGGNGGRGRGGYDRPAMENDAFDAGNGPAASRGRSGRGGREGGRAGRGGRGGSREGQEGRPTRRQYDRRDGTGRGSETEKRHGAGRGNWGAEGDELKEEAQTAPAAEEAKPVAEEGAAEEETPAAATPEPETEEEKEMTLDEYEKMMEEKNANLNKAPAKKAAKADMKEFEGMTAYTRKDVDADEEENELELKNKKQIGGRKSGATVKELKTKEMLVPSFRVGDDGPSGERGGRRSGRGGRGGERGSGRRGPRGDRPPREDRPPHEREDRPPRQYHGPRMGGRGSAAPAINDAHAFPTLGN